MAHNFLEDSKGNKSSKRLGGVSLIALALIMSLILFVVSLFKGATDPDTAISIINSLLTGGGFLLGAGLAENLKIIKK